MGGRRRFLQQLGGMGLLLGLGAKDFTKVDTAELAKKLVTKHEPVEPEVESVVRKPGGHVEFSHMPDGGFNLSSGTAFYRARGGWMSC